MLNRISVPGAVASQSFVIYGKPGAGKTTLLGTAGSDPRTAPILVLDFDGGSHVMTGMPGVHVLRVTSWEDFEAAFQLLGSSTNEYRSLGIDNLSEVHNFALFSILDDERIMRISKKQNPDQLQQGDYGTALVQMRMLVRRARDLGLHLFLTAWSEDVVDVYANTSVTKPAVHGKLQLELPGIVNNLCYLGVTDRDDAGQVHRVLMLQNGGTISCRVRLPYGESAPDYLTDPTITMLFDTLKVPPVPQQESQ